MDRTQYRGYTLQSNDVGTDIWQGAEYIDTTYGPDKGTHIRRAMTLVDEWHDAP